MPGTIQVSVLEFKGLWSSSSPPPQISITVSMGKKEYQTWGKEEFSFPLTTLRDNLMIKLHDAEGNEISHTAVDSRLVVEKGVWDEAFTLEGGGQVHLKLKFVLSEEERQRIRIMRESALRKKHGELPSGDLGSPKNATASGSNAESLLWPNQEVSETNLLQSKVAATRTGLVSNPADVIEMERFATEEQEQTFSLMKQTIPIDARRLHQSPGSQGLDVHLTEESQRGFVEKIEIQTPLDDVPDMAICSEEASSLSGSSELAVAAKKRLIAPKLDEDKTNNPEKQSPVRNVPSNVRNMISAFESSVARDMRPHIKSLPLKFHSSKIATGAPPTIDQVMMEKVKPTETISKGSLKNPFLAGGLQQSSKYTRQVELSAADFKNKGSTANMKNKNISKEEEINEGKDSSRDLMRAFTGRTATVSGRMLDEHMGSQQSSKMFMNKRHSVGRLSIKESGIYPEYSEEVDNGGVSNDRFKSNEYWKDKHYSSICPGTWIFPVESRRLCITTGSKHLTDLMRTCHTEADIHHGGKSSAPENVEEGKGCGGGFEVNEGDKTNKKPRKSKHLNSADIETSRGPVGQVMRVAIMIGFATLVLLTRQRNNS